MSRFKSRIHAEIVAGKLYRIDAALVPALRHIPADMLPPVLAALDRELRSRHKAWVRADKRAADWRVKWMDQAMFLRGQGKTPANIGNILAARPDRPGSADRIARALREYLASGLLIEERGGARSTALKKKSVRS